MLQGHLLYNLFSDSACTKEALEGERWQNESCLLMVLLSARLHGAPCIRTAERILQGKKCTFMLAHFKRLIQAAQAIILYAGVKENLCTLTPTHAETRTHLHKLFAYQYIPLSSFMPFAVTMRTHTKTVCLPDRRHMPVHRRRTFCIYHTFANGKKLQAITPDPWCKEGPESPEVSDLSFYVFQRHSPAAASVVCNPWFQISLSHIVFSLQWNLRKYI